MKKEDIGFMLLLFFAVFVLICLGITIAHSNVNYDERIALALKECEKELPRHLNCEVIITAKVIDNVK